MNIILNLLYYFFSIIIFILHSKAVININIGEKGTTIGINNGVKYINIEYIFLKFLSIKVKQKPQKIKNNDAARLF